MHSLALVVHGGAGTLRPEIADAARSGVERALAVGWSVLKGGGTSRDACEQAILLLENHPAFDAGFGAYLNRAGKPELDAMIMDGASLKSGGVAAVERIRNPIHLARCILENSEHALFVGRGAEQFAIEHGIELCEPGDLVTPEQYQRWLAAEATVPPHGTVGAVARDGAGNLCAGTSTGGTFLKQPGRVGDSPLIGSGCYADNESAAISCTGHGESIMKVVMAKTAADFVAAGLDAKAAADAAVNVLSRRTAGAGGLIVVDKFGRTGAAFSTPHMTWTAKAE
jgi:beta-aspartyl-peptidase (threonine type)